MPFFIVGPGAPDHLMTVMVIFLILAVLAFGILFLRLHTLPERMAHSGQKLQFEIVAVLGLISLFTHIHLFWIAGLLLAMVDLPDFGTPLKRMAKALERIAGIPTEPEPEAAAPAPEKPMASDEAPVAGGDSKDGEGSKEPAHA
jgi:hypothetical protein